MTVVCAWCHTVVKAGSAGAGVTHTICASCIDWTLDHPTDQPREWLLRAVHDLEDLRAADAAAPTATT